VLGGAIGDPSPAEKMLEKIEKHQGLLNVILTLFLVVANILLWITTRDAVREARNASQGTLMMQLNTAFFRDEKMYGIRKAIESKKPILQVHKGKFTEQELEDFIGLLDMTQGLVDRKFSTAVWWRIILQGMPTRQSETRRSQTTSVNYAET
jgi:hypothetical protein